jgi:hypothetical protein
MTGFISREMATQAEETWTKFQGEDVEVSTVDLENAHATYKALRAILGTVDGWSLAYDAASQRVSALGGVLALRKDGTING